MSYKGGRRLSDYKGYKIGDGRKNHTNVIVYGSAIRTEDEDRRFIDRPKNCSECIYKNASKCPRKCIHYKEKFT
jgi:hypothetical protein